MPLTMKTPRIAGLGLPLRTRWTGGGETKPVIRGDKPNQSLAVRRSAGHK